MKRALAFILLILIALAVAYLMSNSKDETNNRTEKKMSQGQTENLKIEDLKVGDGTEAKDGNTVSVHYTGTLLDGTKFDSSLDRGTPFEFVLGQGSVIQGWEQGVKGMKVGGKRKLIIAPELGYGDQAVGSIPANSTLVFEVELLDVK